MWRPTTKRAFCGAVRVLEAIPCVIIELRIAAVTAERSWRKKTVGRGTTLLRVALKASTLPTGPLRRPSAVWRGARREKMFAR